MSAPDSYSWSDTVTRFKSTYAEAYADVKNRYEDQVRRGAEAFRARVQRVMGVLITTKARILVAKERVKSGPQSKDQAAVIVHIVTIEAIVNALIEGIRVNSIDMRTGKPVEVGLAPVVAAVLVIGTVGLSVAGVLAALAAEKYADSLQTRADTIDRAVSTMSPEQAAKALADTNPPPATPPSAGGAGVAIGLGALALGAGGLGLWWWTKHK